MNQNHRTPEANSLNPWGSIEPRLNTTVLWCMFVSFIQQHVLNFIVVRVLVADAVERLFALTVHPAVFRYLVATVGG